ncbi:hypothetical protein H6G00_01840 [Leptolyngbya sp. FACHB-541]|uniref:hypothetical protein n=1 Tax=Leptolyngbya sp. FACHB-541 TaxID=2692810 RepID=UPI001682BAC5|nr:hypothetical protein [Leptolyngbya sp. FACHB-541]MBD1995373.1 hypothetical protein [Leptolyngbya sp. FACHB-541]
MSIAFQLDFAGNETPVIPGRRRRQPPKLELPQPWLKSQRFTLLGEVEMKCTYSRPELLKSDYSKEWYWEMALKFYHPQLKDGELAIAIYPDWAEGWEDPILLAERLSRWLLPQTFEFQVGYHTANVLFKGWDISLVFVLRGESISETGYYHHHAYSTTWRKWRSPQLYAENLTTARYLELLNSLKNRRG